MDRPGGVPGGVPAGLPGGAQRRPRLGVFGDVVLDIVVLHREDAAPDSDSRAAITPTAGGSAANVAVWAARSGLEVAFFGQAGDDLVGRQLRADLAAEGVAVDRPAGNLHLAASAPTGIIIVNVHGSSRTMVTDRGANLSPPPDLIRDEALAACAWLHLTGYSFFEPGPREVAQRAVKACRRLGVPFSADPSSYRLLREYGAERFLADVDGAAVLFPNRAEARELTGRDDPAEGAAELARRFPVVAVKLGPDGCLVAARGALRAVPAVRPDGRAIDPTGAGDAFAAGFLAGLLGVGLPGAGDTRAAASGAGDTQAAAQSAVRLAARAVQVIGGRGRG